MTDLLKNIKAYFSTGLGIILICLAVVSAYFDLPKEHSILIDLVVGSLGFVLIFTDPAKIASDMWEIIKNKFK